LGIIVGIGAVLLVFFFYIYLPSTTNHNETLTVPDLVGTSFSQVDDLLTNRNLRYEVVVDSGYSDSMEPEAILSQNPKGGAKVKEGRKIYLTLNANVPPKVRMPNLINTDKLNAEDILKSNGLKLGEITYVPDRRVNAVIAQQIEEEDIQPGEMIFKGSSVDLVIGDGEGLKTFPAPDFLGKNLEEANFQIEASGLKLDEVQYILNDTVPPNRVYKQRPPVGVMIQTGDLIQIWINSTKPEEEEEEEEGNQ